MSFRSDLIGALRILSDDLRRNGNEADAYFSGLAKEIDAGCDRAELLEVLDRLSSSGAIRQYAGFSVRQNGLYEEVLKLNQCFIVELRKA